jgi:hypothetical protein
MEFFQRPAAGPAQPEKDVSMGPARVIALGVWNAGWTILILVYFAVLLAQAVTWSAGQATFVAQPPGIEELLEFVWLLHLWALSIALLRTPLVARVLDLAPSRTQVPRWRLGVGIALEVLTLILILIVMAMARGNWPQLDFPTPEKLVFVTIPVWFVIIIVFLPFFPRGPATRSQLQKRLKSILPEGEQGSVGDLAGWLADAVKKARQPDDLQKLATKFGKLTGLLPALAGQTLEAGSSLIQFGRDNTLGDVSIGDVHLGPTITINLQNQPG